jgi:cell shape-determining protein MreC
MKKITLNNIEYTYQRKEIHIGDLIITDNLDNVYEASIHDADDIGNVVTNQINKK